MIITFLSIKVGVITLLCFITNFIVDYIIVVFSSVSSNLCFLFTQHSSVQFNHTILGSLRQGATMGGSTYFKLVYRCKSSMTRFLFHYLYAQLTFYNPSLILICLISDTTQSLHEIFLDHLRGIAKVGDENLPGPDFTDVEGNSDSYIHNSFLSLYLEVLARRRVMFKFHRSPI